MNYYSYTILLGVVFSALGVLLYFAKQDVLRKRIPKKIAMMMLVLTPVIACYIFNIVQHTDQYDYIKVTATGESASRTHDPSVLIEGFKIDGKFIAVTKEDLAEGKWSFYKEGRKFVLGWTKAKKMDDNLTDSIMLRVPIGYQRAISFESSNEYRGIVAIALPDGTNITADTNAPLKHRGFVEISIGHSSQAVLQNFLIKNFFKFSIAYFGILFLSIILFILLRKRNPLLGNEPVFSWIKYNAGNTDYMSKESIAPIKGFFVILIFLRHAAILMDLSNPIDNYFSQFNAYIGQLIVTLILFYTGYGVTVSVRKKPNYMNSFPVKRILKTFLHFAFAVIIFYIFNSTGYGFHTNTKQTLITVALTLVGFLGIGINSWYIFAILIIYLIIYFSFRLAQNNDNKAMAYVCCSLIVYSLIMWHFSPAWNDIWPQGTRSWDSSWYNTVMCVPLGMWFAKIKEDWEKIFYSNNFIYGIGLIILSLLVAVCHDHKENVVFYWVMSALFCLAVTLFSMKISITAKPLIWLGDHLFEVYVLHTLPLFLFYNLGLSSSHKYLYLMLSFVLAVLIADIFKRMLAKFDRCFFKRYS